MLIKQGIVQKKNKGKKNYLLTLTNQPRLYLMTVDMKYKSDFLLTPKVKAYVVAKGNFNVTCGVSGKVWSFKTTDDETLWV